MSAGFKHTAARVITLNHHMAATAIKGLTSNNVYLIEPNNCNKFANLDTIIGIGLKYQLFGM